MTVEDRFIPEDHVYLDDCTCLHEGEDHGWGECGVPGCHCEGHWTE